MPAPSSIVPIDIACSFRIDRCTCVPGPSRPGHAPRTGPPASAFRIVRQPRGGPRPLPGTRSQHGRPVAGLARLCCEKIAETGGILSADPPRAQEADKKVPVPPVITSRSRVSRVEILVRRCRSFNSMRCQKGGQKGTDPHGSSLGRYAVRPPLTPGLKSGIHLIAGRLLDIRERTACERKGDAARIDDLQ